MTKLEKQNAKAEYETAIERIQEQLLVMDRAARIIQDTLNQNSANPYGEALRTLDAWDDVVEDATFNNAQDFISKAYDYLRYDLNDEEWEEENNWNEEEDQAA